MSNPQRLTTVLIVDDNVPLLAAIQRNLRSRGIRVVTTGEAIGVSRLLREEAPDVVVLDINMPALNGDALARLIRAQRPAATLPIIFFSAKDEDELAELAAKVEGTSYVSKSAGPEALFDAIRRATVR